MQATTEGQQTSVAEATSSEAQVSCCFSLAVGCELRFVISLFVLSCSATGYFNTADTEIRVATTRLFLTLTSMCNDVQ